MLNSGYEDGQLLALVGLLYDAVTEANKWCSFAQAATRVFSGGVAHLIYYDSDARHLCFSIQHGAKPDAVRAWERFLSAEPSSPLSDPRAELLRAFQGRTVTNSMFPDCQSYEESRFYLEMLKPFQCEFFLCCYFEHQGNSFSLLGIMRGEKTGPFAGEDVAAMDKLAPHFRRAIHLHKQLMSVNYGKGHARELANIEADGLATDAEAQTHALRHQLRALIDAADPGQFLPGKPIAIPGSPTARPLPLGVGPLSTVQVALNFGKSKSSLMAVWIAEPNHTQETVGELLQRLYGLTPAEARVLDQLAAGKKADEIAQERGVLVSTVRSQIKSLFIKTGTNSQAGLVRLALNCKPLIRF